LLRARKNNIAFVKALNFRLENTTGSDIRQTNQLLYYENVQDSKGFLESGVDGDIRARLLSETLVPANDFATVNLQDYGVLNELLIKPDVTLAFSLGATGSSGDIEVDVSIIWHEYYTQRFP
jgi:hypothetical protein